MSEHADQFEDREDDEQEPLDEGGDEAEEPTPDDECASALHGTST